MSRRSFLHLVTGNARFSLRCRNTNISIYLSQLRTLSIICHKTSENLILSKTNNYIPVERSTWLRRCSGTTNGNSNTNNNSNSSSSSCGSDNAKLGSVTPQMAILYTCKVCGTRSAKTFAKKSYEKGIVIVRCPGCENLHLIADNLGWFKDTTKSSNEDKRARNVEQILAEKGENVKRITNMDGTIELADIIGQEISDSISGKKDSE